MDDQMVKYKTFIAPKVEEVRSLCNRYGIPCFMAFGPSINVSDDKFDLQCVAMIPEMYGIDSNDRRFQNFVNVKNGFIVMPPQNIDIISLDSDAYSLPKNLFSEDDYDD